MKIVVLDGYSLNPGDLSWSKFSQLGAIEIFDRTSPELVVQRSADADVVLTNKTPLDGEALTKLSNLKYIGVLATGYNIVDTSTARKLGITVTNVPDYGTSSVAQFVFALLLELCHQVALHHRAVKAGEWSRTEDFCFWTTPQIELEGKNLGVIGFGRIGRRVAQIGVAFGMRVLAAGRKGQPPPEGDWFQWLTLEQVLAEADVVSLHCPLTSETEGMINAERLALMKATAFLINTSRGPLIVDQDLANSLNSGGLAGAALDVLSTEPPAEAHPLLSAKNCLVTPHIAWATQAARRRLMKVAFKNLAAFLEGRSQNLVGA